MKLTLLQAIARMEGYYAAGSRPARNRNPGDLEYGKFARAHGATGSDGRFAIFPTEAAGFAALADLLRTPGYAGKTLAEVINRYAPPVENATNHYIGTICGWTGLTAATAVTGELLA